MTSRWPLVTGSNEPGQTTRRTSDHAPVDGTGQAAVPLAPAARPYQSVASPYLRDRSGRYPAARSAAPTGSPARPRPGRPARASRARRSTVSMRASSSSASAYGGSANTKSRGSRRRARAASTRSTRSVDAAARRAAPSAAMFVLITCGGPRSDSTSSDVGGAARQRLQPDRARAGVQVERRPSPSSAAADAPATCRTAPRGSGRWSAWLPGPAGGDGQPAPARDGPAMIRVMAAQAFSRNSARSCVEQRAHRGGQARVGGQRRVGADQGRGLLPGLADQVLVGAAAAAA